MNTREKNEQKKEGLFDARKKGGQSRHTRIYSHHRSTGVTHTHTVFLAPAQNKEREEERERSGEARSTFFLSTIKIRRRRCGNKNDSSLFFLFFCSFLRRRSL